MMPIVGGSASGGTQSEVGQDLLVAPRPSASEQRLADALLRCMGRWGLAKTTIEDIAREAGMSRATAYRLYPGGKSAILEAAVRGEVVRLVEEVSSAAGQVPDPQDCIVCVVHHAACFLDQHDALRFMCEHEPVVIEQLLGFERADALLATAGELLVPVLARYFDIDDARRTAVWISRIVLSYLQTPSPDIDLTDLGDVQRLVRTFVVPGLALRDRATSTLEPTT